MPSPFDYIKTFLSTKDSLYDSEELFKKDYVPFVVNRALSNDPKCLLFADALNTYPMLDSKIQHDFYLYGLPKMFAGKLWSKKDEDVNLKYAKFVAQSMNVSLKRAYEILPLLDDEDIETAMRAKGGKSK